MKPFEANTKFISPKGSSVQTTKAESIETLKQQTNQHLNKYASWRKFSKFDSPSQLYSYIETNFESDFTNVASIKQKLNIHVKHLCHDKPKGTIFLFHGLSSCSKLLSNVAGAIAEAGLPLDIVSYDTIGHGCTNGILKNKFPTSFFSGSPKPLPAVLGAKKYEQPDNFVPDDKAIVEIAWRVVTHVLDSGAARGTNTLPVYLYGESMGAATSLLLSLKTPENLKQKYYYLIRGIIPEAPPVIVKDAPKSGVLLGLLKGIAWMAPAAGVPGVDIVDVSRVKEQNAIIAEDVECNPKGLTMGTVVALVNVANGIKHPLQKQKEEKTTTAVLDIPMLLFQGTEDKVVHPDGAQIVYDGNANSDKTIVWFEQAWHTLNRDLVCKEEMDTIIAWLKERLL